MPAKTKPKKKAPPRSPKLEKALATVATWCEAMPGATISPKMANIYHVMGKTFAILWTGKTAGLIVKTDIADMLRETYAGIGHKSHLDSRHWIFIELDSDVPLKEVHKLIQKSHALVASGLTKKQQAQLDALRGD
ncbi:MAG: MmcQ/YjbR family DNA-binding protein [Alphaproteobacteria bacterium]|nr:MmcQ/YjbR family DNA-binding protein [Alphaproteobacteria bacterium]